MDHEARRFGRDFDGLPIEQEIDKAPGVSAQETVREMGAAGYNAECRGIVERHVAGWCKTITRLGRWVDFDDDYKTMDVWYFGIRVVGGQPTSDRGSSNQGMKVMPVSTALETVLANFETGQNYIDVQDPSVTVLFKLVGGREQASRGFGFKAKP